MTSELRLDVSEPTTSWRSSTSTSRPARARACATAKPTAPAPITTASQRSAIAWSQAPPCWLVPLRITKEEAVALARLASEFMPHETAQVREVAHRRWIGGDH